MKVSIFICVLFVVNLVYAKNKTWKDVTSKSCHKFIESNFINSYGGYDYEKINRELKEFKSKHLWAASKWVLGNSIDFLSNSTLLTTVDEDESLKMADMTYKQRKELRLTEQCSGQGFEKSPPCNHIRLYCLNSLVTAVQDSLKGATNQLKRINKGETCKRYKNVPNSKCISRLKSGIEKKKQIVEKFKDSYTGNILRDWYNDDVIKITDDILQTVDEELEKAKNTLEKAKLADEALAEAKKKTQEELEKTDKALVSIAEKEFNKKATEQNLKECKQRLIDEYPERYGDYNAADGCSDCTSEKISKDKFNELRQLEHEGLQQALLKMYPEGADIKDSQSQIENITQIAEKLQEKIQKKKDEAMEAIKNLDVMEEVNNCSVLYKAAKRKCHSIKVTNFMDINILIAQLEKTEGIFKKVKNNCRLHHYLQGRTVNDTNMDFNQTCYETIFGKAPCTGSIGNDLYDPNYCKTKQQIEKQIETLVARHNLDIPFSSIDTNKIDPSSLKQDIEKQLQAPFDKVIANHNKTIKHLKDLMNNHNGYSFNDLQRILLTSPKLLQEVILDGTPESVDLWCQYNLELLYNDWFKDAALMGIDYALDIAVVLTAPLGPVSFAISAAKQVKNLGLAVHEVNETDVFNDLVSDALDAQMTDKDFAKHYEEKLKDANDNLDDEIVGTMMLMFDLKDAAKVGNYKSFKNFKDFQHHFLNHTSLGKMLTMKSSLKEDWQKKLVQSFFKDVVAKGALKTAVKEARGTSKPDDEVFMELFEKYAFKQGEKIGYGIGLGSKVGKVARNVSKKGNEEISKEAIESLLELVKETISEPED